MKRLFLFILLIFYAVFSPQYGYGAVSDEALMDEQFSPKEADYCYISAEDFSPIEKALADCRNAKKLRSSSAPPFLISHVLFFYQKILSTFMAMPVMVDVSPDQNLDKVQAFLSLLHLF